MLEDFGKKKSFKARIEKARKITSTIYNSTAAVNLLRETTNGCDLLRPSITRFATEHLAIESLLKHRSVIQNCFTSDQFRIALGINDKKKKKKIEEVCNIVLTNNFWTKANIVFRVMDPLVRVLKVVD